MQLDPPYIHRRNVAERAIQTFKHHFIAGLASASASFPLSLWYRLLQQATMTLNMLRTRNIDSTKSAYEEVYGRFDYNTTPLVPPGSKATVHRKPNQRTSWGTHGVTGYCIGPAMMHYRSLTFYLPRSGGECTSDTSAIYPNGTQIPVCYQLSRDRNS